MLLRLAILLLGTSVFVACDTRVDLGDLPPCDRSTCPGGCCHEGLCVPFSGQDADRCGSGGQACVSCGDANVASCSQGQCTVSQCGPCTGCCDGNFCMPGSHPLSCGRGGQSCARCVTGELCTAGACTRCGPHNCDGCCNELGECVAGNSDFFCGSGGEVCDFCTGFTNCVGNVCR
ncbi:MAG: hypothetical protein WBV82_08285 [Myxococcaceae bacterium]